jgi:hypothetical protein
MPVLLQFSDGRQVRLEVELDGWAEAFDRALQANQVVQVEDPDGDGVFGINPGQVLYWKIVPETPPPATDSD